MNYTEMLDYIKSSNTWEMEHLHTSWALAIPSVLIKSDKHITQHINAEWHSLCSALFYRQPENAIRTFMEEHGYTQVKELQVINYQSTILLNHSCKTYVVFGDILEVFEDGVLTQYENSHD